MAALSDSVPDVRTVDLREIRSADLVPLLEEEVRAWRTLFDWNFAPSAELLRRFVDLRSLNGCALMDGRELAGYSYYVQEERKALIGDLYVRSRWRTPENESLLLGSVVAGMMASPQVRRIESQLMMLGLDDRRPRSTSNFLRLFDRRFLSLDFECTPLPEVRPARHKAFYEPWEDRFQELAAQLIAETYHSHVDSQINDQYRSPGGARRFLYNIVQYPGCGQFFRPASLVAFDFHRDGACGLCLTSLIAPEVGHITQICVAPQVQGRGVGFELLARSLQALRRHGCRRVSLTVTSCNRNAVELYERIGFQLVREFSAYVWEGFR
ncbi:MAG: N-acetyltransferase [Bryobacterales bacterium]|nr:N-acetyltransferase [Bryobacterales bacterium]